MPNKRPNIGGATIFPHISFLGVQAVLYLLRTLSRSDVVQDMVDGRSCRNKADAPVLVGRDMNTEEEAQVTQCLFASDAGYKLGGNIECEVCDLVYLFHR
jgi:hypothetical protein